ncbi:MAG: thioredoxin family protein [Armatimonadota bacterium]|nr:thioredoxin family protein [Armatimonadota bacterium]MDR7427794.1 thioredoxin family protein [Armatimonadota bacterium]MDR7464018.1 thioredoxin family protein [Armatimonadota bacterium]MDR7468902.1 thioredoxin family protein [Armatimonadota bacterium]MDR7474857.1 thioredoxin family protein [Armatimonadota bacterium]
MEIFGPGCPRCHATKQAVQQAVRALGLEATITEIADPKEMARQRIIFTPAVRINSEVKCAGRVPQVSEVTSWLATAAATAEGT